MLKVEAINISNFAQERHSLGVLAITATDVETAELHKYLKPLPRYLRVLKLVQGNQTYYIGRLGRYAIVHLQCEMGSISPNASLGAITEAINFWNPKAAIMLGIAFGINPRKQHVGDVLLSKVLVPYDIRRIGSKLSVFRSAHPPVSTTLFNRFKHQREWRFPISNEKFSRIIPCDLLSGESLIDNMSFRNELLKQFPKAEGGEMEGVGLFSAAHTAGIHWIVVKSICDFADGKKSVGKTKRQKLAAAAAASLCNHVFSIPNCFGHIGCEELNASNNSEQTVIADHRPEVIQSVLFDLYRPEYESNYLQREIDQDVSAIIRLSNIWLVGESGTGKTNILQRTLYKLKCRHEYFDLSSAIDNTMTQLFSMLATEFVVRFKSEVKFTASKANNLAFTINQISSMLNICVKENVVIVIDEIPISSSSFQQFVDAAVALILTISNTPVATKVKFAFSSLISPFDNLRDFQTKFKQKVKYYKQEKWSENELVDLLKLLSSKLRLNFSAVEQYQIVSASNGSPRVLKEILRTRIIFYHDSRWTLTRTINEVLATLL